MSTWTKILKDIKKNTSETRKKDFLYHRIRYWDPIDRPVYYFKIFLLYLYNNIKNTTKVKFKKNKYETIYKKKYSLVDKKKIIDFDFIQSCYEYEFICNDLNKCKTILEIGAGYGRSCNFILKLFDKIESYIIIDFEEIYNKYAKNYLKNNLSKSKFNKILFLQPNQLAQVNNFDLAINIDSMQEMYETQIDKYLKLISEKGNLFYSSNALVKYRPKDFELILSKKRNYNEAMKAGKNKTIINVFDTSDFNKEIIERGVLNYQPQNFVIKKYQINKLIPFYADSLYKKIIAKNVLVLSGGGYIGHVLVKYLLKKKYHVTVIDRFIYINKKSFRNNKNLYVIKDDIRKISPSIFKNKNIVIDLTNISIASKQNSLYDKLTWEIDYKTRKKNIILSKKYGVQKFLYPSSCSVYGFSKSKILLNEDSYLSPKSTYSRAQAKLEKFAIKQGDDNFCIAILRLPTVFGVSARTRFDVIINSLVFDALNNNKINLLRNGKQKRPFVHIEDVARAFNFLINIQPSLINNQIFNIGDEKNNTTLLNLSKLIFKKLKIKENIEWYGKSDDRSYFVSFKKIKKLGFKCKYDIPFGINELKNAIKNKKIVPKITNYNIKWLDTLNKFHNLPKMLKFQNRNKEIMKKYSEILMYGGILDIIKIKKIYINFSNKIISKHIKYILPLINKLLFKNYFNEFYILTNSNNKFLKKIDQYNLIKFINKKEKQKLFFNKVINIKINSFVDRNKIIVTQKNIKSK